GNPVETGPSAPSTTSDGDTTEPIQDATATSYVAVCTNAAAASALRWAYVKPPARTAVTTSSYRAGSTTTATDGWFFAAARTMDGPPMSICSTTAPGPAPDATVAANGQRLTTTSSNGAMSSCASWSRWSCLRVSARMPACTRGCSVLTRPSRHSGKPVSSSTGVTGMPASAIRDAVEPVETSSTPASCSAVASSVRPV